MAKIILLVIIWLTLLFGLVLFLPQKNAFPFSYEKEAILVDGPSNLWHLANFDGVHYQNIARQGYITRFQTAFFPLYPLAIKSLSFLAGGNLLVTGLLISFFSTLASLYILNRLDPGGRSIIWLFSFPTAFFLLTGYTEALFLFLSLLTWWLYSHQKFFLSGLAGLLSSLTRFYGILLFPVVLIDYFQQKTRSKNPLSLFIIPLGLLFYMFYLYREFHDPLYFFHALSLWQKSHLVFPPQTIYRYLKILLTVAPSAREYWIAVLELGSLVIGTLASVILLKKRQFALSVYLLLGLLIPTLTGTLQSLPRYLLVLFPLYFVPGSLKSQIPTLNFIPYINFGLQLILFASFLRGGFVS